MNTMKTDPTQHSPFIWPVRVYWEDTDAGGVVYHASYLRFLERARSEWLRHLGIEQHSLHTHNGVVFVVHHLEITFHRPARLDDLLLASVALSEARNASFTASQHLRREPEAKPLVEAQIRIACVDASRFRPCAIPHTLLTLMRDS